METSRSNARIRQIEAIAASGWNHCASVREGLRRHGLPAPTAEYLKSVFAPEHWARALRAVTTLREHFAHARFADAATFGIVLVPNPEKLDTRGAIDPAMRGDQVAHAGDFIDPRLPAGKLVVPPGPDWTLVATITGAAGIHFGSYDAIHASATTSYTVDGVDTRSLMVRQIWGARVLQCGREPPDSNARDPWTFTLFPGEKLVAGAAASGTVLHERVRFRLGRTDRGISSVRICPALVLV